MAIINKAIGLSSVAAAAIATASSSSSYAALPSFLSCSASQPSPQRARTQLRTSTSAPVSQTLRFSSTAAMAIGSTVAADHFLKKDNQTQNGALPEVVTEFMVDMKCEGCASSVRRSLEPLEGVKRVDVDLQNQVVRVQGTAALKTLNEALEQAGRRSRLIGQGASDYIYNAAIVAEFKGPEIFGVVRIVQVSMELARIEASFSGLSKGQHGWSINEYGDLTRGAASTGNIYNMPATGTKPLFHSQ